MKKTSKRRWILTLLTGVVALLVVVRRRMQPIESRPLLPVPPLPPSDPPRIVLPTEILNAIDSVPESIAETPVETLVSSEAEAVAAAVETAAPEQETEAPLLEREVGGVTAAPAQPKSLEVADDQAHDDDDPLLSYCVSCRTKRPMVNTHEETTENGRRALRGTCEVCGSKMFRFLPNQDKVED
jgi:hypothetical protein